MVEEPYYIGRMLAHRIAGVRLAALPTASEIRSYYAIRLPETRVDQSAELVRIRGQAVQQDYCRLRARIVEIVGDKAVNGVEAFYSCAVFWNPVATDARVRRHDITGARPCVSRRTRFSVFPAVLRGKSSAMMTW